MEATDQQEAFSGLEIAIVGIAGRFPGAESLDQFWQNLRDGVEGISVFTDDELAALGVQPDVLQSPDFVKAAPVLKNIDQFDAAFFGYAPREAELMDPQHRIFLECAWEALERAGYNAETFDGLIGVYAGTSLSSYLLFNLLTHPDIFATQDTFPIMVGNDKDFLSTRVSYALGLRGPGITVQTGCSTSLVATHLACESLLSFQCDMALAGGVSVNVPQRTGYSYQPGGIMSPDGHCRAFDAAAQGTLFGSGAGVVVLKRLGDAQRDGDTIYAVIKGSAINNDGTAKVGYTAPSVDGQAEVIVRAQAIAGIAPETISYVEAHGTGTALGDPVEVAALTKAFQLGTARTGYCALGSVKSNIGHLDAAAGIASLLKVVLALRARELPPTLHFRTPNPQIPFTDTPFYVSAALRPWSGADGPRRAGVSSFGIGGTNAHLIVEEAPAAAAPAPATRPWQLLVLSAKSATALQALSTQLATALAQTPGSLADVAYTLQVGRRAWRYRRTVVCQDVAAAVAALGTDAGTAGLDELGIAPDGQRGVTFLFPGQGAQYVDMGRALYTHEPVFRAELDRCAVLLEPLLGRDLRAVLYPETAQRAAATAQLGATGLAQPALFAVGYALAQQWIAWGVRPEALLGHSVGEYVAATLAGVFTLEAALGLVATRGRLMEACAPGAMLAVALGEDALRPLLGDGLSLAAINGPTSCVVSGPTAAIDALAEQLGRRDIEVQPLHTSHAFHSALLEPMLPAFRAAVAQVRLQPPQLPVVSNVSGTWLTAAAATDPEYWVRQARQPVQFSAGLATVLAEPGRVLLEVGPGTTLSTLARRHPGRGDSAVVATLRHAQTTEPPEAAAVVQAVGRLWRAGVLVDWTAFQAGSPRQRLPLPTYPFERQRFWIEPQSSRNPGVRSSAQAPKRDLADWFYTPSWKRTPRPAPPSADRAAERRCWLLFMDQRGLGQRIAQRLSAMGQTVVQVWSGEHYGVDNHVYTLNPRRQEDYVALFQSLQAADMLPQRIVHLWSLADAAAAHDATTEALLDHGFYSLLFIAQRIEALDRAQPQQLWTITNQTQQIERDDLLAPAKAPLLGACMVIPQELPHVSCQCLDIALPGADDWHTQQVADQILSEVHNAAPVPLVAYRGDHRWLPIFEPMHLTSDAAQVRPLRRRGVYLITGGLGTIGLALAEYLARTVQARLVLLGRSALPAPAEWTAWQATHDSDDPVSRKIQRLRVLQELGAEVLTLSADVADEAQMWAVISTVLDRFGELHGVIHTAGRAGKATIKLLSELDRAECATHFRSKLYGTQVLERVLQARPLDFVVLFSSNTSILGGVGSTGYTAAHMFMDAFAAKQNRAQQPSWLTINWDAWQDQSPAAASLTALEEYAISFSSGVEAFGRVVQFSTADQVIVSSGDLTRRLSQGQDHASPDTARSQDTPSASLHIRPTLPTRYVAPNTALEQKIVAVWQAVLGIDQVGVDDNFFDLGGSSLLGLKVIARLKHELEIDLPATVLFEGSTVSALARLIDQQYGSAATGERAPSFEQRRSRGERRRERRQRLHGDHDESGPISEE